MKSAIAFLISFTGLVSARGQTAPTITFKPVASGGIELSWNVEKIYAPAPDLLPKYVVEVAHTLGNWQQSGPILAGESFPTGKAFVMQSQIPEQPVAFFRVLTKLDFTGRDLIGRSLTNGVFSNADFSGADLLFAKFTDGLLRNATLRGADLRAAKMERVDAHGADFVLARLGKANCEGADFRGADLRFVDFIDANLTFASLENADLSGAILEGTTNVFTHFHGCKTDALTVMDPEIRATWEIVNLREPARIIAV
jgi:hypothetical protein